MKNYGILLCSAAAVLLASPAWANHCDADAADVQWLLDGPATAEKNAIDAARGLLAHAQMTCVREEELFATAAPESPIFEADHVTLGQSMLINAKQLIEGN